MTGILKKRVPKLPKTKKQSSHRILVMAHAHPDFSLGGGEISAYNLFKAYKSSGQVEDAWFLARADRQRGVTGSISKRRDNEYLWEQGVNDWHLMRAAHLDSVVTWFADLVRALRPTFVHTHHYAHLGLEYLGVIKQIDPSIQIMMTLHEFMAICENNGQMIKKGDFRLCFQSGFDECRSCFPSKTAEDFWLRKHRFLSYFELVDKFVSPSEFLRQRYINWGVDESKIVVIENGQDMASPIPPRALIANEKRNRFGFFGQINPFKGLEILLSAINQIPKAERKEVVLEVHGANLELQSAEFQEKIKALCDPLIKQGIVQWLGPYLPHELPGRMANVDWVCVPSIWWENSPMVIQEAFRCGRPLLVSDIGGMKEKVSHGVDGFHVPVGNPSEWRAAMMRVIKDVEAFDMAVSRITYPQAHSVIAAKHLYEMS